MFDYLLFNIYIQYSSLGSVECFVFRSALTLSGIRLRGIGIYGFGGGWVHGLRSGSGRLFLLILIDSVRLGKLIADDACEEEAAFFLFLACFINWRRWRCGSVTASGLSSTGSQRIYGESSSTVTGTDTPLSGCFKMPSKLSYVTRSRFISLWDNNMGQCVRTMCILKDRYRFRNGNCIFAVPIDQADPLPNTRNTRRDVSTLGSLPTWRQYAW